MRNFKVDLSFSNVAIIAFTGLALFLASQIAGVFAMLFIAFIIYAGLRPVVDRLEKYKLPRPVAVVLIYILLAVILFVLFVLVANQFVDQAYQLIGNLPQIYKNLAEFLTTNVPLVANILPLQSLGAELSSFVKNVLQSDFVSNLITGQNFITVLSQTFGVFGSVAGSLIGFFTVIIISVYMLQGKEKFYSGLLELLPKDISRKVEVALSKIEDSLGSWVLGQLTLMLMIGTATYILVSVPAIFDPNFKLAEYAVPIAIVAGILEALPNVGPAVTTILAALLAIGTSGPLALVYVVLAFGMLQNLEAVLFVPNVMRRAVGIHPIITILGIIGAFQLFGVLGAVLIVPLLGVVHIIINEVIDAFKNAKPEKPQEVVVIEKAESSKNSEKKISKASKTKADKRK